MTTAPPIPPALVLTAGHGTRLRPLSSRRAKPAVPVAGTPLVTRVLEWLVREGVTRVVLNLHHQPHTITGLVGHGDDLGLDVRYSWETKILGSAGGPRRARELLGPRFFVINGDTLTDVDLAGVIDAHHRSSARVTMVVADNPDPARYGGLTVDADDRVTGFVPAGTPSAHFVGIQLVESDVFDPVPARTPASTVGGLYDALLAREPGAIAAHRVAGQFFDVGTPADYLATSLAIARAEDRSDSDVSPRSEVHPTAVLTRSIVWEDAVIEADCQLVECIVTDGVRIPAGSRHERTIITPATDGLACAPLDGAAT